MNTAGSTALVTGGVSGLGRATVVALQDAGLAVVVLDRSSECPERGVRYVNGDVRKASDVNAALDIAGSLGPLRVCVNCAGIGIPARIARAGQAASLEDFIRVVEVNLVGTYNVARLASSRMQLTHPVEGGRGVIINTASVAAFEGQIGQVAYSASKAGIVGMTLPIARDLADSLIRCVTIAPGIIDTPLLGELSESVREALARSVPHPARLGYPKEYASLVIHIIENDLLNGEVIRLDGALRMAPR